MKAARWLLGVAAALALGGCATTDKNGDLFGEGSWAFDARTEPEAERLVVVPGTAAVAVELPEEKGGYPDIAGTTEFSDRVLRPRGLDGTVLDEPSRPEAGIGYSVIIGPGTPFLGGANSPFFPAASLLPSTGFQLRSGTDSMSDLIHQPGEVQPAPPGTATPGGAAQDRGGGTGMGLPAPGTAGPAGP